MSRLRRVKVVLVILVIVATFVAYSEIGPRMRREVAADKFELVLTADRDAYQLGERPKFSLKLKNKSLRGVLLVPALDGSDIGRYPLVEWSVTPPPDALPIEQYLRCGNTNPLRIFDFRIIPPRFSLDVCATWCGGPRAELERGPGEYAVQVTYSTMETDLDRWLGGPMWPGLLHAARIKAGPLLAQVPRFTVASNTLKIRFESPFASPAAMLRTGTLKQAMLALREIETAGPQADDVSAVIDALARFRSEAKHEYRNFAKRALPMLNEHTDAAPLERLWTVVEETVRDPDSHAPFGEQFDYEMHLDLLPLIFKMQAPEREARLIYLLTPQPVDYGPGSRMTSTPRRPIMLNVAIVEALRAVPGDDIDRVLEAIYHSPRTEVLEMPGYECFPLLETVMAERDLS